mmetsp:Transcript_12890/g.40692  ORF Transcript_12890/g.40692 Transcript_12890/m.40692 type:complete len:318 (+) Transcript_12890:495-1448(+)
MVPSSPPVTNSPSPLSSAHRTAPTWASAGRLMYKGWQRLCGGEEEGSTCGVGVSKWCTAMEPVVVAVRRRGTCLVDVPPATGREKDSSGTTVAHACTTCSRSRHPVVGGLALADEASARRCRISAHVVVPSLTLSSTCSWPPLHRDGASVARTVDPSSDKVAGATAGMRVSTGGATMARVSGGSSSPPRRTSTTIVCQVSSSFAASRRNRLLSSREGEGRKARTVMRSEGGTARGGGCASAASVGTKCRWSARLTRQPVGQGVREDGMVGRRTVVQRCSEPWLYSTQTRRTASSSSASTTTHIATLPASTRSTAPTN